MFWIIVNPPKSLKSFTVIFHQRCVKRIAQHKAAGHNMQRLRFTPGSVGACGGVLLWRWPLEML